MSPLKALFQLEFSRFRLALPGLGKSGRKPAVIYYITALLASFILFQHNEPPAFRIAIIALILMATFNFISFFVTASLPGLAFKEWWLTMPHSRKILVFAKALAYLRVSFNMLIMAILVCASNYYIALQLGQIDAIPVYQLFSNAVPDLLFVITILPLLVTQSLTVIAMQHGWSRLAILPYTIMLILPVCMVGVLFGLNDDGSDLNSFLAPKHIWLAIACVVLVGWPLAYLFFQLTARLGMHRLANNSIGNKSINVDRPSIQIKESTSAFLKLYRLERTRYFQFTSLRPVKWTICALALCVAVGAYFCPSYKEAMIEFPWVLFMIPMMGATIFSMNINSYELQKKRLQWWLSFPYPRSLLIFSRVSAVWVIAIKGFSTSSFAFWFGVTVNLVLHPENNSGLHSQIIWFAFTALLYIGATTVVLGLLQIANYLQKTTALSLFTAPLFILVMLGPQLIHWLLYPKKFDLPIPTPDWLAIQLLYLLGIPIAAACLMFGAKYLHVILRHESSPQWARYAKK